MPRLTPPVLAPGILREHEQPTLVAADLVLRPWEPDDAPVVFAAYQDPAIRRWHTRGIDDLEEAVAWIEQVRAGWDREVLAGWAVEAGGHVVGRVVLRFVDLHDGIGEVGYWTLPSARGRGHAGRAVTALCSWALDDLGLHRIELEHSVRNTASCRVADRAGFVAEGTRRAATRHVDGWHDMHVHVRLAL